mgnify:FL=1
MNDVAVVGAGLAGCEAAYQLAERGVGVTLYDMKPSKLLAAYESADFAELVCSNSLRSDRLQNAAGLLKEELRRLGSMIIQAADENRVPAGGALAVDRVGFSRDVTRLVRSHPLITVVEEEVREIPECASIIATGPLTDGALMDSIESLLGESMHFFDAAAPIVTYDSLNMDKVFMASRYGRGSDYLNCPMNKEEYFSFVEALKAADTAVLREFEDTKVFEGCMPVEVMAKRGDMTLAFGPLKPVGLMDERRTEKPFAVVQLRRDDADGRLYNMVGFQMNLKFGEQKRVFSMIPGLENVEFVRYGVMHRNSYLNSPAKLGIDYCYNNSNIYFAGQITGVEGYVESIASGYTAGLNLARRCQGKPAIDFTKKTAIGALSHYISEYSGDDFQPMNINFGIIEGVQARIRNKQERYAAVSARALSVIDDIIANVL